MKIRITFIQRLVALLFAATLLGSLQAAPVFPVKYGPNSRYLVDQNNVPFPIMGRTSWFATALPAADYRTFVDDTAARGFNAIEIHVLNHDPRGSHPPFNGTGAAPFLNRLNGTSWNGALTYNNINNEAPNFTTPNEAYWSVVDGLLAYCESKGVLVFMFPAYVGYNGGEQGWMQELVANGPTRIQSYGAWIATRYKDRKNIVWMMGGDMGTGSHPFNTAQTSVENALLTGLKSVAGQQSVLFSAEWDSQSIATDQVTFGSSMTLNGAYSWTGDVNYQGRRAYAHSTVSPAFLLEEPYDECGPDGNNYNPSAIQPVRRFQWWGWLSTIGGYICGNGYVWPFNGSVWLSHLDTQGTRDMTRLNNFMGSIAWYNLVPSGLSGMRTLVTAGGSSVSASDYVSAAAAPDGTLVVAYIPPAHNGPITVDMAALSGTARARWFDPTSAAYTDIGTGLANTGTRVFTIPGNNSVGQQDWVLVLDRATGSAAPTISDIPNQSTPTNTPTAAIPFTIGDTDTAVGSLTLSGASSNPTLVPPGNIVFGGSGASRTVTVSPANNQSGSATLTVSVSDGTNSASDTFVVTVNAGASIAAVRVNAGGGAFTDSAGNAWSADTGFNTGNANAGSTPINNTVDDVLYQTERWDASTSPELAYSFNLPNGGYLVNLHFAEIYSGAFAVGRRVFDVLVEGQLRVDNLDIYSQVGPNTALIIALPVTVADGQLNISFVHGIENPKISGISVFLATATPATPTISDIANQSTTMNTPTAAIPFTIGDADTAVTSLTLGGGSSNPTLVSTNNIVFGGSGSNRTVTLTPTTGQTGTATITVSVSDGTNSASDTFVLTVNAVNTPPTISGIADQTLNEDTSTAALGFTVGDAETAAGSLTLGKSSSNPSLVPTNSIVLGGSGANRTVTVSPAANQNGTATITVSVNDGQFTVSTNFVVTVSAVNDAPTISAIANQTILANGTTGPLNFTVADVDTAVGSLTLSGGSSNPTLVPPGNIVFGGSGANRTVTVSPATNQTGTATITVSVSDGALSASNSFVMTVNVAAPVAAVRVNAGGGAFTDSAGNAWSADTGFNTGNANAVSTPINNTVDDVLYQTERWDASTSPELAYSFNLPNGDYSVNLHFAEIYSGNFAVGRRVFDVLIEGQLRIDNLDIYSQVGANTALIIGLPVTVADGQLNIAFVHGIENPKISAIGVFSTSGTPVTPAAPTISDIANQFTTTSTPTPPIAFTIGDTDTPVTSLTLGKGSSNPTLVPTNNIVFGGSGANRTVTLTPATGQTGTATITVSVSDGTNSASDTFVLTVSAASSATTKSFTNTTAITIPDQGAGTPYPSVINVTGMGSTISNVTVTLRNLNQTWASDVDVLLVGPGGQKVMLMSDAGNGAANNVTLTLSDAAAAALPTSALASGTFRPVNYTDTSSGGDNFPSPAPAAPYGSTLSGFNGQPANGTWSLYVFDDGPGDLGNFAGGWSIGIATLNAAAIPIAAPTPLQITSVTLDGDGIVRVTANSVAGFDYTLEASSDLANWVPVDVQGSNISGPVVFTEQPTTNSIRFYRVKSTLQWAGY